MMANKEKLDQLREHIKRLTLLTEEISERDIYPVSFFSQAYDITNTIQEELRQIEIAQIELFEKQMKEHQAQILSFVSRPQEPEKPGQQENFGDTEKMEMQENFEEPAPPPDFSPPIFPAPPVPPILQKKKEPAGEHPRIDLKKIITLNDRFLFCRELFANDENLMNRTIADLNNEESFDTSMDYIKNHFDWNVENDHVVDFMNCLKRSFGN